MINKQEVLDRFISYISIDTQSNPESETTPSPKSSGFLPIN